MDSDPPSFHRTALGLAAVVMGILLLPLDFAVNVVFDKIRSGFDLQQADTYAIVVGYVLAYASLMLVCGRLGDIYGHKRLFVIGMLVSICAFALCAMAREYSWLVMFRVMQGCGMALVYSSTLALLIQILPGLSTKRVASLRETPVAAGAVGAPLAGGWVVVAEGWEAVFWARLPVCFVGVVLAYFLPFRKGGGGPFDWLGAFFLLCTMVSFLLAAHYLVPIAGEVRIALVVIGAVSACLFVIRESRCTYPIISLDAFRQPIFFLQQPASVAINGASFTVFLLFPFILKAAGWTFGDIGRMLALAGLGTLAGSIWFVWRPLQGRQATGALLIGVVICSVGLALVGYVGFADVGYLAAAVVLQGIGLGVFQGNYAASVASEIKQPGIAGSLTLVTRTIGVVIGTFVFGLEAWFERSAALLPVADGATASSLQIAFRQTFLSVGGFLFGIVVLLLLFWASYRMTRGQRSEPA